MIQGKCFQDRPIFFARQSKYQESVGPFEVCHPTEQFILQMFCNTEIASYLQDCWDLSRAVQTNRPTPWSDYTCPGISPNRILLATKLIWLLL